jgi:hypothetical protein
MREEIPRDRKEGSCGGLGGVESVLKGQQKRALS